MEEQKSDEKSHKEIKLNRNSVVWIIAIISSLVMMFNNNPIFGIVALIVLLILAYYFKKINKYDMLKASYIFFVTYIAYFIFYIPAISMAAVQGPVLSDNWWNALNWIKQNTPECATIATYWDPGHFITGIARRPVVFDGASQGATLTLPVDERYENLSDGINIVKYEKGIEQIILRNGDNITRARIKDIAISLFTNNESLAISLLKDYKKPNCSEMYFIASSDLIGKSHWWTYFSTWDSAKIGTCPIVENPKGDCYAYSLVGRSSAKPLVSEGVIAYEYPLSNQQKFVIYESESGKITPMLQIGADFRKVEKIFFFAKNGSSYMNVYPDADVKGMLWLTPAKDILVYIPPELEDSLFTRMFFFNGMGLEHFEFINNWGGEVKLFRVLFNTTLNINNMEKKQSGRV